MRSILLCLLALLSACQHLKGMTAADIRAAMDNCQDHNLDVLLYKRPDNSVVTIRCYPKSEQVSKTVTLVPRVPASMLKFLYEKLEAPPEALMKFSN